MRYVLVKKRVVVLIIGSLLIFNGSSIWAGKDASDTSQPFMVLIGKEQDLAGCKLLGPVTGAFEENGSDLTYPERLIIARDSLRNKTKTLGGNTVHVLHTVNTARYASPGVEQKIVFSGNAYACE